MEMEFRKKNWFRQSRKRKGKTRFTNIWTWKSKNRYRYRSLFRFPIMKRRLNILDIFLFLFFIFLFIFCLTSLSLAFQGYLYFFPNSFCIFPCSFMTRNPSLLLSDFLVASSLESVEGRNERTRLGADQGRNFA